MATNDQNISESTPLIQQPQQDNVGQKTEETQSSPTLIPISIAYLLAMSVCGTIIVATAADLSELAANCGTISTEVATVFVARGVGAITGAVSSAKLYKWYNGNWVMVILLAFISVTVFALPFNTTVWGLHVLFFLFGLTTAIVDTGCQIMTRSVHGKAAGPWLGANTVAFGLAGAIEPLISVITSSLYTQYITLSVFILGVLLYLATIAKEREMEQSLLPQVPTPNGESSSTSESTKTPAHYHVELVIGCMVFFFIGGNVTVTAYLDTYVSDRNLSMSDNAVSYLVMVLWVLVTCGRLFGVYDQRWLTNKTLPIHLTLFCVIGTAGLFLLFLFPYSVIGLWIGICIYAFCYGPTVGMCYDWNNRLTYPTEVSMAIVMFGLNLGVSIVPYVTAVCWDDIGSPTVFVVSMILSMSVPVPLLYVTKYLSYDPLVNPLLVKTNL